MAGKTRVQEGSGDPNKPKGESSDKEAARERRDRKNQEAASSAFQGKEHKGGSA